MITQYILDNPRCGVWAGMGTGKTSATLTALDILTLVEPGPALVIAPLRVAQSTWPDEAAKWLHLSALTMSAVIGDVTQRRAALARKADVYTINYENIPWLVEYLGKAWPFTTIVADESTKLKGFRLRQGGQRAQYLARVAHKARRFIELTGTPSPNGLQDLWGQAWFLDRGERLGFSFSAFTDRWFRSTRVGNDPHAVQITPMPFAQAQIENQMRTACITIDAKDYFDIQEPIVNVIQVEMPPKARRQYRDMEQEMFLALDGGKEIEAFNAASKTIKCLQLANGAIYTDDTRTTHQEVHNEKIKALESIIEEAAGMPVLVAYHFKHDLARLRRAFPQGRALDADPGTIRAWNDGKIPVLFAHPASAGHGLSLQDGGNIIAFFGLWWDMEQHMQIIERIGPTRQAQSGYDRPVFVHYLTTKGTLDTEVLARLRNKKSIQDTLLDAMKTRI
jgi:SNF2 family DNA or RNA helicase